MGIHGLTKFLSEYAPEALTHSAPEAFINQSIAIDASLSLYQFMVAIRDQDSWGNLTNAAGETTSHLSGMFTRAIRIMELGMKPVYVFDGKPPTLKSGELAKRSERKALAEAGMEDAKERGDVEAVKKHAGRMVKVTKQHNEDVKRLLKLMGIPIVEAPGEAEAQCAVLCKANKVSATATEDADALCFGTPVLMRYLTFTDPKKTKLMLVNLSRVLEKLCLSMEQFIDFCILCGCDYSDTIRGVGPNKAYQLIFKHHTIENVLVELEKADSKSIVVPDDFPYQEARQFFLNPEVTPAENLPDLNWVEADEEGLIQFLVDENQFSKDRVTSAIARLKKARRLHCQTRLESFFGVKVKAPLKPETGGGMKRPAQRVQSKEQKANKKARKSAP
eukprot:Protomagalhaensia_sp_Gyna_25__3110@NODE_284_length_4045_cov_39_042936_g218_i0_p1_GENE_NODE_284_length_4045_cov_39_042936_g218_i0NODE_284_length_4045_cov_39_042936_g218_i0_p1_ORF_typecomplete_len390_score77_29XPG_I/PF00867_18/1_5e30XPG_N/PF00752_17/5_9e285_3_exonuc/PF01367_20/0_0001XPG_I_2/PF12813_7/0_00335_3_exonuc_N/PF02739_16/0_0047DUF4142/PF13628_6/0_16DUF4142/PF13628_6/1_6e03_NODE_284_length_4045_cov_39_042936_g218_i07881957